MGLTILQCVLLVWQPKDSTPRKRVSSAASRLPLCIFVPFLPKRQVQDYPALTAQTSLPPSPLIRTRKWFLFHVNFSSLLGLQ